MAQSSCHAVRGKAYRERWSSVTRALWLMFLPYCKAFYIVKYKRKERSLICCLFSANNIARIKNFRKKNRFLVKKKNFYSLIMTIFLFSCFVYKYTSLKSFNARMQLYLNSLQKHQLYTAFFEDFSLLQK